MIRARNAIQLNIRCSNTASWDITKNRTTCIAYDVQNGARIGTVVVLYRDNTLSRARVLRVRTEVFRAPSSRAVQSTHY